MLCGTFLLLLIQLGPSSLNEDWHIYKIVEPVVLTAVVILVLIKGSLIFNRLSIPKHYIQCPFILLYFPRKQRREKMIGRIKRKF